MPNLLLPWSSLHPFLPEVVLVLTMCLVLIIPIISPKRNNLAVGAATALGLLIAMACLLTIESNGDFATHPLAPSAGGAYFNGMLIMDPFGWFFKIILFVFTLCIVGLWAFTTRTQMGPGDGPEFFVLLLAATVGMCLMASTTHLLMMFLAIEMASLPSYVLAGFRKTHRLGAEASLKYVLFGTVSSAVMLYGMSLLYGLCGSLQISAIASLATPTPEKQWMLAVGLIAVLVGIGFKIALVPMHFWAPDVFEGTNMDVAAFLSVASKGAGLVMLLRVLYAIIGTHGASASMEWLAVAMLILGGVTCSWANLAAFAQNNIKRLLAYSSIAHAGYMLLGLSIIITPQAAPRATEALLFYLFLYLFMNAGAFIAAAAIARQTGSEDIRGYADLGRRSPLLAFCMLVFVFSLVGIPLTIGFFAKLKIFQVLYDSHHWVGNVGLAILAVNAVVAAFYYFRILKQMYFTHSEELPVPQSEMFHPIALLAALLVLPNIGFFFADSWVDDQAHTFAKVYVMPSSGMTAASKTFPAFSTPLPTKNAMNVDTTALPGNPPAVLAVRH